MKSAVVSALLLIAVATPSCSRFYGLKLYGDARAASEDVLRREVLAVLVANDPVLHPGWGGSPDCRWARIVLPPEHRITMTDCFFRDKKVPEYVVTFVGSDILRPGRLLEEDQAAITEMKAILRRVVSMMRGAGVRDLQRECSRELQRHFCRDD